MIKTCNPIWHKKLGLYKWQKFIPDFDKDYPLDDVHVEISNNLKINLYNKKNVILIATWFMLSK
jgi:hypothetical protein